LYQFIDGTTVGTSEASDGSIIEVRDMHGLRAQDEYAAAVVKAEDKIFEHKVVDNKVYLNDMINGGKEVREVYISTA
jgi:hypothetical protein